MARLTGNKGAVYVSVAGVFTKVGDVYDWRFTTSVKMFKCTEKGDTSTRWTPSRQGEASFTAKRRTESDCFFATWVLDSINNAGYTTWRLDLVDNNGSFCQITCSGYARGASFGVPVEGGVDDMIEFQIDDVLSIA